MRRQWHCGGGGARRRRQQECSCGWQEALLGVVIFCPPSSPVKALCRECVVERCRVLRLKNQLNEDYKAVASLLKGPARG